MTESSEHTPGDHHRAKLAAEITAGAAAASLVGGAAIVAYKRLIQHRNEGEDVDLSNQFRIWGKRRNEVLNSDYSNHTEKFKKQVAILFDPNLREVDRPLLPEAAVRTYIATRSTMAGVVTRDQLAEQLGVTTQITSHVMGFLRDNELAYYRKPVKVKKGYEPTEEDAPFAVGGFYAGAALAWAIDEGLYPPLNQRLYELMYGASDSTFGTGEES